MKADNQHRGVVQNLPNIACTRTPANYAGAGGGSLRDFEQFSWLEVGSVKAAWSRPAHQRVTPTVGRLLTEFCGIHELKLREPENAEQKSHPIYSLNLLN